MVSKLSFIIHLNRVLVKSSVECSECAKCDYNNKANCKTVCTATYDIAAIIDLMDEHFKELVKKDNAIKSVGYNRLLRKFGNIFKKYESFLK